MFFDCRIFPPPSQSYYCLLKVGSKGEEGEELRQYLVCFLSIGKEGLDLYPSNNELCIRIHAHVHVHVYVHSRHVHVHMHVAEALTKF